MSLSTDLYLIIVSGPRTLACRNSSDCSTELFLWRAWCMLATKSASDPFFVKLSCSSTCSAFSKQTKEIYPRVRIGLEFLAAVYWAVLEKRYFISITSLSYNLSLLRMLLFVPKQYQNWPLRPCWLASQNGKSEERLNMHLCSLGACLN